MRTLSSAPSRLVERLAHQLEALTGGEYVAPAGAEFLEVVLGGDEQVGQRRVEPQLLPEDDDPLGQLLGHVRKLPAATAPPATAGHGRSSHGRGQTPLMA